MQFLRKFRALLAMMAFLSVVNAADAREMAMPHVISGGATVWIPIGMNGVPLPASNGDITVEASGLALGPSQDEPQKVSMAWAFSVSVPKRANYKLIKIEDVTGPKSVELVREENPKINRVKLSAFSSKYLVHVSGKKGVVSQETSPWLYQLGPSVFVFRVSLIPESGDPVVLYQASSYDGIEKSMIREMVAKAANNSLKVDAEAGPALNPGENSRAP